MEYTVRLVIPVEADDPTGAVDDFINRIVEHGLTRWIYHITDTDGNLVAYANGDGIILDEEDLPDLPPPPVEDVPLPDTAATPEPTTSATPSDDELLALADELNGED